MITNFLSPLEFIVSIKRLPNVQFFTQRLSIPSVSTSFVERPTPFKTLYETPDKMTFSELNFSFIIDENMKNYIEIFEWMKGISFPDNFSQYKNLNESEYGLKSDISAVILNSHKNPVVDVYFKDCFPISLSEISLDTTQSDIQYPEASVTFVYNSYEIRSIS